MDNKEDSSLVAGSDVDKAKDGFEELNKEGPSGRQDAKIRLMESFGYRWRKDFSDRLQQFKKENQGGHFFIFLTDKKTPDSEVKPLCPSKFWMEHGVHELRAYRQKEDYDECERIYEDQETVKEAIKDVFAKLAEMHAAQIYSRPQSPKPWGRNTRMKVTKESVLALAKRHNFVTGKWLLIVPWSQADDVWMKLVQGLKAGAFPADLEVLFVKVFGRMKVGHFPASGHYENVWDDAIISIMTKDWTDEGKAMRVTEVLQGLGISGEMRYKPDVYSELGINRKNVYGILPSIYQFNLETEQENE